MCGIFGCAGDGDVTGALIEGLKRLEYRGYDSAGVAVLDEAGRLQVVKKEGRIAVLERYAGEARGSVGIAHTRWATHGKPSDANSHPHRCGKFALVHNGIIENFAELRAELSAGGAAFTSETDTEAVVRLLAKLYDGDLVASLAKTTARLTGSYALAVVSEDNPNEIVATKRDSPLIVGVTEGAAYLASDAVALAGRAEELFVLEDGEYAVLGAGRALFLDAGLNVIRKQPQDALSGLGVVEKGAVNSFMLKEMLEIPEALKDTLAYYENGFPDAFTARLKEVRRVVVVACGTAYHAGLLGRYLFEDLARVPTNVEVASEFRYREPILEEGTLVVAVSQSGETADTLAAVRLAKADPARPVVAAVTNVATSTLTRLCDFVLPTRAGAEIAVAATKSYNTQLVVLYRLAMALAEAHGRPVPEWLLRALAALPAKAEEVLQNFNALDAVAKQFFTSNNVFFLGRGLDYATAIEGSLKLKEISYINSEGYPAGEIKHGTLALIEENSLVTVVVTQRRLAAKTMNALHEVRARGAKVLLLTSLSEYEHCPDADYIVRLPAAEDFLMPVLSIIPLQLFAYFMAIAKGNDPDKPRNLAKSVTVE